MATAIWKSFTVFGTTSSSSMATAIWKCFTALATTSLASSSTPSTRPVAATCCWSRSSSTSPLRRHARHATAALPLHRTTSATAATSPVGGGGRCGCGRCGCGLCGCGLCGCGLCGCGLCGCWLCGCGLFGCWLLVVQDEEEEEEEEGSSGCPLGSTPPPPPPLPSTPPVPIDSPHDDCCITLDNTPPAIPSPTTRRYTTTTSSAGEASGVTEEEEQAMMLRVYEEARRLLPRVNGILWHRSRFRWSCALAPTSNEELRSLPPISQQKYSHFLSASPTTRKCIPQKLFSCTYSTVVSAWAQAVAARDRWWATEWSTTEGWDGGVGGSGGKGRVLLGLVNFEDEDKAKDVYSRFMPKVTHVFYNVTAKRWLVKLSSSSKHFSCYKHKGFLNAYGAALDCLLVFQIEQQFRHGAAEGTNASAAGGVGGGGGTKKIMKEDEHFLVRWFASMIPGMELGEDNSWHWHVPYHDSPSNSVCTPRLPSSCIVNTNVSTGVMKHRVKVEGVCFDQLWREAAVEYLNDMAAVDGMPSLEEQQDGANEWASKGLEFLKRHCVMGRIDWVGSGWKVPSQDVITVADNGGFIASAIMALLANGVVLWHQARRSNPSNPLPPPPVVLSSNSYIPPPLYPSPPPGSYPSYYLPYDPYYGGGGGPPAGYPPPPQQQHQQHQQQLWKGRRRRASGGAPEEEEEVRKKPKKAGGPAGPDRDADEGAADIDWSDETAWDVLAHDFCSLVSGVTWRSKDRSFACMTRSGDIKRMFCSRKYGFIESIAMAMELSLTNEGFSNISEEMVDRSDDREVKKVVTYLQSERLVRPLGRYVRWRARDKSWSAVRKMGMKSPVKLFGVRKFGGFYISFVLSVRRAAEWNVPELLGRKLSGSSGSGSLMMAASTTTTPTTATEHQHDNDYVDDVREVVVLSEEPATAQDVVVVGTKTEEQDEMMIEAEDVLSVGGDSNCDDAVGGDSDGGHSSDGDVM
eukprot:GHVS01072692.1.p1 GENE.GHVS01072692.1~~GHVS01072692.1.p1  ORF type:complete len:1003 (-),score=288.95 GHVS01072692.1:199-3111(-)